MVVMILCVASLLVAGAALGWYSHRAYVRIDAWGRAMNEQDAIFRLASEEELDSALRRARVFRFDGRASEAFHAGAASAK
jgi:hypothetical protein